jgi:23S rRNA (uridine2552-2'-O)-methyltransferase
VSAGGRGGSGRGGLPSSKKPRPGRRKASSRQWIARQLRDPYVIRSRREGLRSRAAYKLIEIDDRYGLFRPGLRVVDLGAAPGGWSQVAAERVRSPEGEPRVVAVDVAAMEPLPGVAVVRIDALDPHAPQVIRQALGGNPADVVLSDMAAPTTGHRATDHLRTMALCEAAADLARQILAPGGHLLAKVFRGGTEQALLAELKRAFARIHHVKPPASRPESPELYLLAMGFRPQVPGARSQVPGSQP